MTETKTTSKENSKSAPKSAETSAIATTTKESAVTDNIYLAFLQKAFPTFGIPADALKKVEEYIMMSWQRAFSLQAFPG